MKTSLRLTPHPTPIPRLFTFFAIALLPLQALGAPSVQPDKASYQTGESIVVTFAGGPANPKDWVGIYRDDQTPGQGGATATLWFYVDGTRDGTTGKPEGILTFASGLPTAGNWAVLFLENDGYTVLATATIAVTAPIAVAVPSVLPNHATYFPGEAIQIGFQNGPGNARDWIGVYPVDAVPGQVGSTIWNYVGGTQTAGAPLREGSVNFPNGLNLAGDWAVYFLLNDGYTKLATNHFSVIEPGYPALRLGQRTYATGETITATFTNGPANPKDWVGIYRLGQTPGQGGVSATLWYYVDGTRDGLVGKPDGTLTFSGGLNATGDWVAYYLLNDGYDVLGSESFRVIEPVVLPRIVSLSPANGSTDQPPTLSFAAALTNGVTKIVPSTIALTLDGSPVQPTVTTVGEGAIVTYTSPLLPDPSSSHTWLLTFGDTATPPNQIRAESRIIVAAYRNIVLPDPLYFENFDAVAEGALPAGWTQRSYTSPLNETVDFGDLGSLAYAQWTVVNASRFEGSFVTYSNPDNPASWAADYQRVLRGNPMNVLNGQIIEGPLAQGRFLLGNSGYQNSGASQVLYLFTPDFDLTGKSEVHVAFKSLWEQNQDSLAAIEYSIDGGQNWLPIAYFLDGPDIVRREDGSIDIEATLETERGDIARYTDENGFEIGGSYGAFLGAPLGPELAPYIQARVDDDPVESKRIELYRLPQADNQARVRFRFAHAGTDSWYFGIDDFGIYSIGSQPPPAAVLTIRRVAGGVEIAFEGVLESAPTVTGPWNAVPNATSPYTAAPSGSGGYFRSRL